MFVNLHIQYATTLLALLAVVLAPAPILFYYYGERIRMRSRFAVNVPVVAPAAAPKQ